MHAYKGAGRREWGFVPLRDEVFVMDEGRVGDERSAMAESCSGGRAENNARFVALALARPGADDARIEIETVEQQVPKSTRWP